QIDAAERGQPHHVENKDRDKLGTAGQTDQMANMDHDAMMKNATPQQMLQGMDQDKQHFSSLKGQDFDRMFVNRMSTEHRKVISMAQTFKQNCSDQDVCRLIDTMLPKLQQHQQMADQLKAPAAQGRTPEPVSR